MCKARTQVFEQKNVFAAVLRLGLPTIAGQVILVLYHLADTFFIGLTENDAQLISVTVCMPAFMILSAIANLFGVGGASAVSRAHGAKDDLRACRAGVFSVWGTAITTLVYSGLVLCFLHPLVSCMGGRDPAVHENACGYMLVTVVIGGFFTSASGLFSHVLRAEGSAVASGTGIILGGVLNILLDPLFMFVLLPRGSETLGAALATALSNAVSFVYYIWVTVRLRRRGSGLRFRPCAAAAKDGIPREILGTGLSACLMTLFENLSCAVLDNLMMAAGLACQAGVGVAKKLNMLSHSITRGMAQGILPFVAYNYSRGDSGRMRRALTWAALLAVGMALGNAAVCMLWGCRLTAVFLEESGPSAAWGSDFLRILCLGAPFSAFAYIVISFFQSVGKNRPAFLLAVLRKGAVDIPLMFLLRSVIPVRGVVWATPIADCLCCAAALTLFLRWIRRHRTGSPMPAAAP